MQKNRLISLTSDCSGGLLGFFVFNPGLLKFSWEIFGSLALGGMLAAISMALHQEWTLLLIGFGVCF